ncbi:MAG: molecular chaperone DnaJ, partial [Mesorhizobium sp.]|nr:molecular chaperone DnaJ [Mesorhizobium sp.]
MMGVLIVVAFLLLVLLGALALFLRADPAGLADTTRSLGPVLLGLAGFSVLAVGRVGLGGAMLAGAAVWYGVSRAGRKATARQRG